MTKLRYRVEWDERHLKNIIETFKKENIHNGYGTSLTNSSKELFVEYFERILERMNSSKGREFTSLKEYKDFCEKDFPQISQTITPSVRLTEFNLERMGVKHIPIIWEPFGSEYYLGKVEVIHE